jgi:hypothetical protein
MKKSDKIIVIGSMLSVIGIILICLGFDKYKKVESALTMVANGPPPGIVEFGIGLFIAVAGGLAIIHGFGMLPEEPKTQERVTRDMQTRFN